MREPEAIPALSDNYIWGLHDGQHALIVDPGQAAPVLDWLHRHSLALHVILLSHHHADHIGAVPALRHAFPNVQVWGPDDDRIPDIDHIVGHGERIQLATPAFAFEVIAVPGHTRTHIAFHGEGMLFCGDTLFSAGCGRLFEGTPAQMLDSLSKLAALPDDTRVCCGHEYTLSNLGFALHLEPARNELLDHIEHVRRRRDAGQPSLPSTIAVERRINPFLRSDLPELRRVLERERGLSTRADSTQAFAQLRQWKDEYRG